MKEITVKDNKTDLNIYINDYPKLELMSESDLDLLISNIYDLVIKRAGKQKIENKDSG